MGDDVGTLNLDEVAALVFMGGHYSVNEHHSWVNEEIKLITRAIKNDMPLMGVCFGAQLISKALGAEVSREKHMETGWHKIKTDISALTNDTFEAFEWHEDTFSIPDGAIPIFSGRNFENQGYLYGKVLCMQFHLEMTEDMIYEWLRRYNSCMPEPSQYVQSSEQMPECLNERLVDLHRVADKIYGWWLSMVKVN